MVRATKAVSESRARADGRRQLLIYMLPETVKELKRAALDEERAAYELAEEAIVEYLKSRRRKK